MYINHDDIVAIASPDNEPASANRSDDLLVGMDREINTFLSQVSCSPVKVSNGLRCVWLNACVLCRFYIFHILPNLLCYRTIFHNWNKITISITQIQNKKQVVSILKRRRADSIDEFRPNDWAHRISSRWNNDELMLAVKGVREFGKDFPVIAEIIGTKSESQVRTFFVNYRRRYNLDALLKEFETNKRQHLEDEILSVSGGLDAAVIRRQEPEIMEVRS